MSLAHLIVGLGLIAVGAVYFLQRQRAVNQPLGRTKRQAAARTWPWTLVGAILLAAGVVQVAIALQ